MLVLHTTAYLLQISPVPGLLSLPYNADPEGPLAIEDNMTTPTPRAFAAKMDKCSSGKNASDPHGPIRHQSLLR